MIAQGMACILVTAAIFGTVLLGVSFVIYIYKGGFRTSIQFMIINNTELPILNTIHINKHLLISSFYLGSKFQN